MRPLAYAIAAKTKVEIATNPVANPSSPSVRFTALEVAVMVIIIKTEYKMPISYIPFAINGSEIFDILILLLVPSKLIKKYSKKLL